MRPHPTGSGRSSQQRPLGAWMASVPPHRHPRATPAPPWGCTQPPGSPSLLSSPGAAPAQPLRLHVAATLCVLPCRHEGFCVHPKGSMAHGLPGLRELQAQSLAPARHGAGRCGPGCHPPSAHSSRAVLTWVRSPQPAEQRGGGSGQALPAQPGPGAAVLQAACYRKELRAAISFQNVSCLRSRAALCSGCFLLPPAQRNWEHRDGNPCPHPPPAAGCSPDLWGWAPSTPPPGRSAEDGHGGVWAHLHPAAPLGIGAEPPALACPKLPTGHPLCWDQLCSPLLRPRAVSSFRLRGGGSGGFRRAPSRSSVL